MVVVEAVLGIAVVVVVVVDFQGGRGEGKALGIDTDTVAVEPGTQDIPLPKTPAEGTVARRPAGVAGRWPEWARRMLWWGALWWGAVLRLVAQRRKDAGRFGREHRG